MSKNNLEPIAVVGIGAIMPGALSKDEFWKNITEGKNSIIEVPQDRWDYRLFYSEDRSAPDKTYTKIGGFITGFKFNSLKYRIPPSVAKQMDSIQHLALETASMALEDAGYDKKDFDRSRTAVIIANAMGGIKNEYSNTRIYKAFYYDMLRHSEHFAALPPAEQEAIIEDVEASVNAKFLPITEDSMPGELPNVISGRVANVFNLNGTSFSIDAACASSIAALDQAVNGLRVGNYDMALCGGVDQMMSPAAYIKFCKIGALSADGSFAFDARANGFVMAEGAGMVILKRLSDAERDGDKIYGVIRAIGASSDGKGKGITAPNPKGQKLAIENTFKQLDYTPGEVGLMEAHGTATKVGDATELAALDEVFKPYAPAGSIGLGSIKSQIGHAKAAAGIASVIKVMLALHNKVLPPSINFETPNPIVDWASTPFKVITQARPWETDKIRRANVSSFGFGGTNFHLAAEEYHPALSAKKAVPSAISENQENKTMAQTQNADGKYELLVPMEKLQGDMLVFSGESKQDLFNELNQAVQSIQGDPLYLIKAAYKNHTASYKQYAVSINAESPVKLKEKIEFFIKTASSSDVWSEPSLYLKMKGIYPFYNHSEKPKVCFMFPGQGSQYVDMMKDLASKYKVVRDTFAEADVILKEIAGTTLTDVIWSKEGESKEEYKKREEGIKQTQITQPAILTANVAMMRLLYQFGIKPDVTMGHSLGEYGAAVAAGVLSFPDAIRAVTTRGTAMANIKVPDCGKMAAIAASVDKIEPELKKISGYVAVANKNCPTQTVIAGESKSVDDAVALFTSMGIQSVLVPVSHAFHSAIVRPASTVYREFLNGLTINAPKLPITSNVSADFYPSDPSKIRDMMVEQIMSSVEWIKQVELAYARGVRLFIEVGPKRVLSAFVTSTLSDKKDIRVLASNHPKRGGITEFNDLMANLVAAGIWIDWSKTDMNKEETIFNPAFVAAAGFKAPAQEASASVCACAAPAKNPCEVQVAISGIAAGTPGSWEKVFREGNLDEILQGKNFIENISVSEQERQISKNIEYVVKSRVGNHRVEKLTDVSQSVKLAAKKGEFDLEKEFGVPAKWVKSMDPSFTLAIAAGILALKDAGIPLVLYYKPTTAGTYLPDRWGLPQSMIDDTGVIFTSAFPTVNSWAFEVSTKVADALIGKTKKEVRAFYEQIINSISDESLKAQIKAWFEEKFAEYEHHNARVFSQDFLLKAIPIAHSQFCQWIRARGPATHLSGACASTAQAISVAEDWIKLGRAKRVIIIAADDVTNNVIQEWILAGFLASGAVSRESDVTKAALPFDRRRNGMIVGMGAAGLVVEAEEEIRKRGMTPLTRLLATEITNSAFHPTRLDVNHVAEVMDRMVGKVEKKYGLNRSDMSKELLFISHETYTPARGGSASAEVFALKNTFKGDVENVIVSNTKGFTGHSMGAGLEDVIAVHSLNTGNVPPIANYKEPDPELAGINLSKGGHYNFKYALRLAAGFGSQLSMTLQEKTWSEGTPRIIDQAKYMNWLKEASNQEAPVLEVVNNTLRIKDNYQAGKKPALVMEASQAFVDKAAAGHLHTQAEQAPAAQPAAAPVTAQPAVAPAPAKKLDEATVTEEIVNLISEKTGYPKDMLELDLDMEADLGIDTVKQAELFAAMREMYNLPQAEGIQLKDYPTIRHCINYALNTANNASASAAATSAPAPVQTVQASAPVTAAPAPVASALAKKLDEATVTEEIVNLIAEKTGYPKDMLELDLDMEADLGIDTVKQAELFAAMREMYNLPQAEGIQLKDYPTIRHCINYALNASKAPAAQPADEAAPAAQQTAPVEQNAPAAQPAAEAAPAPVPAVTEPKQYEGEDSHNKKLRFIPTLVDAPLTSEANRRLSADRTVLIFSDSAALTRAYVDAFKALGVKTHIFTTLKTRSKNTTIVNWDSLDETTAALEQYAKENPGAVQGIVYLLPCSIKKFDKKINPHADLTKFLMPLFMACKVFVKDMSKRDDADTFLSVVFKVDGAFAYKTKEAISPTIGSVCGAANCLRKDFYQIGGVFSKIMDFEASAEPEYMAEKTIHELLKGDDRGMVSYYQGNRSTLFSVPRKLNMSKKHMDLTGKTVAFTGAGRGLGAILSQKLASQYKARVLILDIIELTDKTPYWATLNEAELKELKQKMWLEMKADTSVRATPVMLERAFGKVKDSITLYKNMQKIKALGGDVDYYQCDVTNGSMMKDVVTRIKAKYGKVDGLIHFAGFERSKLFTDKTTDEYYRTFDIKATSAAAFVALNFVKDTGFYAFASSIAGKYGNLGQSDYASANDFLAKLCISLHNQGQRAVSIDMSAYANVGMGVRPGVVEFLTSHGVKFVDPYDGMQIFLNEIVYGRVPEIVLTDDLGELDLDGQIRINDPFILEEETEEGGNTPSGGNGGDKGGASSSAPAEQPAQESVKQPEAETENFFLGEVKNLSAGKEISAENTFNAEYPFLFDHAIEGTPYVPGVMGIETFMETASMLEGKTPQGLEDVHFYLPIKLLRRRPQSVRIKGVNEGGKVSMEIESDFINSKGVKMGNTRRHFTARVLEHFESKWNNYKNKFDFGASGFAVTKEEIYSKFFHGPSFQVLGGILKIDENAVLGVYEKPSQVLFHDGPKHLLAYPMLIEACFQTCGYRDLAVENRMTLPDSIGKVYIHGKGEAPNKLYTLAVFTGKNIEGKSIYDGFVFDEKGKLWIELSDYQMIGQ